MSLDVNKASVAQAVNAAEEALHMVGAPPVSEQKPPPPEPPSLAGW